jgi:hypothetical protein
MKDAVDLAAKILQDEDMLDLMEGPLSSVDCATVSPGTIAREAMGIAAESPSDCAPALRAVASIIGVCHE